ncbi:CPBP family intramembrane glutamic endopeptidase [Peristeroidobacter agariperforans]|uniref:CPBP family intramembrane glutamic endopeptidase n=1 Tax=Peristeroidobacter agariperforans TaxID=268404 RepID=UPI0018E5A54A|nr:CPBP family intramembrane glutamic endopeptidase [Peristeroidobacter agariperforans]
MRQIIESLSPRAEFATVMLGAFGMFVMSSLTAAFAGGSSSPLTNDALLDLVAYEAVLLAMLGIFLSLRGWRPADVGLSPTLKDTAIGGVIVLADYMVYIVAWSIYSQFTTVSSDLSISADLQVSSVVLLSLVNGFFEELFVCGYLINAVKKRRSVVFAINVSVAIRLAYHLYQGPIAVPSIVPMGLIFGYWFARTGRLWPLVVAHALMDFVALWPHVE